MHKLGSQVWPSPDVMSTEDRLCKVAMLNIALEDRLAYSTVEEFAAGFKTVAFQTNIIRQNRGSSGEAIWIIDLSAANY